MTPQKLEFTFSLVCLFVCLLNSPSIKTRDYYLKETGSLTFVTDDGYGFCCLTSKADVLSDGRWHHLAVSRTSAEMNIYVDGASIPGKIKSSRSNPLNVNSEAPLFICYSEKRGDYYDGLITDVRIWGCRRDPALFGKPPVASEMTYSTGWWSFSGGSMVELLHF
ncbi:hypothetical protein Pelo_6458 [Pelomyxa schiedti]|nr:hypothetical protein Pelo_6458 [Pelomyxa schiedti]